MAHFEEYKRWLSEALDATLLEELKAIENNEDEIKLRFLNVMQFGTAGLRSVTGRRPIPYEYLYGRQNHARVMRLYTRGA